MRLLKQCEALARMAHSGLFGDFSRLDFWVGSTDESGEVVRQRDAHIRQLVSTGLSQ